jgi:DNA-binding LacI/PurR family transcriptional regulator
VSPKTPASNPETTMRDVAAAAGVSLPTVSKVVNGRSDVSKQTRARVERAIEESGYVTRTPTRRPGAGGSRLVDLVVYDLESAYSLEVIRGVEEELEEAGLSVVVSAVHGEQQRARKWVESLRARSTTGAILVLWNTDLSELAALRALRIPLVVLDPWGVPDPDMASVGATNFQGAYEAVEHLVALGHRRVAFIGGSPTLPASRARQGGYRAALESRGVEVDPDLIADGNFLIDGGYEQGLRLLAPANRPTAIFAGTDMQAMGVYRAARELGLRIPEDLSVVGFDDVPIADLASPGLTTVRQPLAEMGAVAARQLVQIRNGEQLKTLRVELATSLVVRESTSPPPA